MDSLVPFAQHQECSSWIMHSMSVSPPPPVLVHRVNGSPPLMYRNTSAATSWGYCQAGFDRCAVRAD